MKSVFSFYPVLLLAIVALNGQSMDTLTGRVINRDTQQSFKGANLNLEGTSMGAGAGTEGPDSVRSGPKGSSAVRFEMMGNKSQARPYREYRLLFSRPNELETIAIAGNTLNKAFQDAYYKGMQSHVPGKIQPFVETTWSIFWGFMCTMWPHDFGHRARARQIGGDFVIESFRFPFPVARMDTPSSATPVEDALTSIGGHEINNLMMRQIHMDFYRNDYAYAIDLINAFIQEVFYPFYAFVLTPAKPEEPSYWIDTRGDPLESTKIVFEGYYNRPAVREDETVDPELVSYYREATYLSVLWTLLDPMLYQGAKAFGADMDQDYGLMTPWMLGSDQFAWIWSTQFHPSPLGYELYLANYLRWNRKLYTLYAKAGRPYRNLGLGISIPALVEGEKFALGVGCDLWDQDIYGTGAAVSLDVEYRVSKAFGLLLEGYWKSDGYLIGKRLEKSAILFAGASYRY